VLFPQPFGSGRSGFVGEAATLQETDHFAGEFSLIQRAVGSHTVESGGVRRVLFVSYLRQRFIDNATLQPL
jgi:hypothetical protein